MPVTATPSTKQAMDGPRLLMVVGSESGTCTMVANAAAKEFKAVCASVEVLEGNELAHELEELSDLKEKYDALVVVTSSFGEGDPPSNYGAFLAAVMSAAKEGAKPLAGLQHAVLGEGSSVYRDTFQNCPRLTDKLLGQLGASRRVKRAEVDEIEEEAGDASKKTWSDAVAKVIKSGKAAASNVCDWTQPADTILDKHDEMLVAAATGGPPPVLFVGAALAVVAAVYFVKFA